MVHSFIKTLFCVVVLLSLNYGAKAQNNIIRGMISDAQTGEGLELANISLKVLPDGELTGTTSDINGLYRFSRLQDGEYVLQVFYVGYETHTDTLEIGGWENELTHNIQLVPSAEDLGELTVSGQGDRDLSPGQVRIDPQTLGRIPTPSIGGDLVSFLQTQTGVVAAGDRGGQLFVRGGTPSENLILMDGTLIYQPFHIIGFFSVFPEEVVSSANFYAGGFSAKYSGRSSSVMDVRLKNGNMYEQNWSASVSPFISSVFFETPVVEGKSSLLVSARGSLIEEASDLYLEEQQPLKFNSQLVKYSNAGEEGVNCSAFFMRTYDRGQLSFEDGETFNWKNLVSGGRCAGATENSNVSFVDVNGGVSYFSNGVGGIGANRRSADIFRFHVDVNLIQYVREVRLEYGFFSNYRRIDHDISDRFIGIQNSNTAILSSGGYLDAKIPIGNTVSIDPGVVFTSFIQKLNSSIEPRLQFSWQPRGRVDEEIHGALGIYRQTLIGVSDFRDAGTAFTAWMLMPDSNEMMESQHALLGWRQPLGRFLDFSVEGYYKWLKNTPVSIWSSIAQFSTDLAYADGTVQGMDARIDFNHNIFYGGLGYGYSITEYETEQPHYETWLGSAKQTYNPVHDRRHQISAQAGIEVGKFSANLNWVYGSGTPFTRPTGFDVYFPFHEQLPNVVDEYGDPRVLMNKPYDARLPDFHRFDIAVGREFDFSGSRMTIQAGAINVYDRKNLFYYDVFNRTTINQLPMLPYVALKMESR